MDQPVKNIQICLVIINKLLGDERDMAMDGGRPCFECVKNSDYLHNLEKLQLHKDDVINSFSCALMDEFFELQDLD